MQMKMDEPRVARLVGLPVQLDERGSLVVIESDQEIQFNISRVFYFYGVPSDVSRGGHAHRELQQSIIALCGSVTILVDDGTSRSRHVLDQPSLGLYVPPMHWIDLDNFTAGAVCLVLASLPYDKADYLRDYDEFIHEKLGAG